MNQISFMFFINTECDTLFQSGVRWTSTVFNCLSNEAQQIYKKTATWASVVGACNRDCVNQHEKRIQYFIGMGKWKYRLVQKLQKNVWRKSLIVANKLEHSMRKLNGQMRNAFLCWKPDINHIYFIAYDYCVKPATKDQNVSIKITCNIKNNLLIPQNFSNLQLWYTRKTQNQQPLYERSTTGIQYEIVTHP